MTQRALTCVLEGPGFQTPPKFNEKTPRESKILWREEEKKSENLGGPADGPETVVQRKRGPGQGSQARYPSGSKAGVLRKDSAQNGSSGEYEKMKNKC